MQVELSEPYYTGASIAAALGIHRGTWIRWVDTHFAPQPRVARSNLKLYDVGEIDAWVAELVELMTEEAA